jgi:Na+/melibiose symporter-like transporter
MSALTDSPERKGSAAADERYVEVANGKNGSLGDGLSDHDRKVLTRKILWKLDLWYASERSALQSQAHEHLTDVLTSRILPVLTLLFLCSFLDRTNVGNAKTYFLEKDLHMLDTQYQTGLAVYYATYIAVEIPSNLVLKKISPKIWLPFLTIIWGIITMCLGFVTNYAGFVAVRALLGIAEGGLLPGMVGNSSLLCCFLLTIGDRYFTCPACTRVQRWLFDLVFSTRLPH